MPRKQAQSASSMTSRDMSTAARQAAGHTYGLKDAILATGSPVKEMDALWADALSRQAATFSLLITLKSESIATLAA